MNITPLTPIITPIAEWESVLAKNAAEENVVRQPTFLDVFNGIFNDAVETNRQKSEDMIRLMLGEADDIEQIQLNLEKAVIATELFVNIRTTVSDAYSEIIRMSI
ncbi:MAG: flagellar hook-basal body complex protein FliE [Oscillospiraceae bacterium]|jgi:flagellar hook-basal body complex protein FliE|nr:flagellar hook-basal body complex protein FliE [Oscillospiraceae bacterium]